MPFTEIEQRKQLDTIRSPGCKRFLLEKEREGWTGERERHTRSESLLKSLSIDKIPGLWRK